MTKIKTLNDIRSVAGYLQRIGAETRSLRSAVIKEQRGAYWKDIAIITISKTGEIKAPEEYAPTESEQVLIKAECETALWPTLRKIHNLMNLPEMLKNADPDDIFTFRDSEGLIVMVQQRIDNSEGGKAYVPWTYWDDDQWRRMEPEGKLPIYGLEQLKQHSVVFVHEGAKAARKIQRMISSSTVQDDEELKNHPWGEELRHAAHVGWIGGALSPHRTDWSMINKSGAKRVYIVSDNDDVGVSAVPAIAEQLRVPTFHIQFTNEWPVSFDLADSFPEKMFRTVSGVRHYIGPAFRTCRHPATWATDQTPNPSGKGKPITELRSHFRNEWIPIAGVDLFVNEMNTDLRYNERELNNFLAAFSHSPNTARLILNEYAGRSYKLSYRPDLQSGHITDDGQPGLNVYAPSKIKPLSGDPSPFFDFLTYLIPDDIERAHVLRWIVTLLAHPECRLKHGLLLISSAQGTGKTTLASAILAPLLGENNVSNPSASEVVGDFNSWIAEKRLVVINEIYEGKSWKAYNKLKETLTDEYVRVNEKYRQPYKLRNFSTVIACSNSFRALKVENSDRRWFVPTITEMPWSAERFRKFYSWLEADGLSIILDWARTQTDYDPIATGTIAPSSAAKSQMIEDSRTDAFKAISDIAETMGESDQFEAITMKQLKERVETETKQKCYEGGVEIKNILNSHGLIRWEFPAMVNGEMTMKNRLTINGSKEYIFINKRAAEELKDLPVEDANQKLKAACQKRI